jgi:nucleotide-binding universal stress UspA family protein
MDTTDGTILIGFDGSDSARRAVAEIGALLPGAEVILLYARGPLEAVAARLEGHSAPETVADVPATAQSPEGILRAGAQLAREAGLVAGTLIASGPGTAAETIVDVAERLETPLVVLGSRGRHGPRPVVLGSVAHHVLHNARRRVLVIPPPAEAAASASPALAAA